VVFDPHMRYLPADKKEGLYCDLTEAAPGSGSSGGGGGDTTETYADKYHDQFVGPFKDIFGCTGRGAWAHDPNNRGGTLFRLPFRSEATARKSRIKVGPVENLAQKLRILQALRERASCFVFRVSCFVLCASELTPYPPPLALLPRPVHTHILIYTYTIHIHRC